MQHDEPDQADDNDRNRQQRVPDFIDTVHPSLEQRGDEKNRAQFGELRRLDSESAHGEPAPCVVHGRTKEDRHEAECGDAETRPDDGRLAVGPVIHAHDNAEHCDAEGGPQPLFNQEQVRPLVTLERHDGRCAVDHDDTEADQQDRREKQDAVRFELTSHMVTVAPRRRTRPKPG